MQIIFDCSEAAIKKAAQALIGGNLVAFPTETVYGLGADAMNEKAVCRLYSVKARPKNHPVIVHISSINKLGIWTADVPDYAIKLARKFWPGPLTLILKRSGLVEDYITGGQDKVGIRVPNQPVALELLKQFEQLGGIGIAAPSANKFGAVSPTSAVATQEEIGAFLGAEDLVLDGGQCLIGIESTIVDCTKYRPEILRPGAVTIEMVENTTKLPLALNLSKSDVKTSGLLQTHYSPKAKVVLDQNPEAGDGFISMASLPTPKGVMRLASPTSIDEFARELYVAFRAADVRGLKKIVVIQPEGGGLAIAIRDRLRKAASGK